MKATAISTRPVSYTHLGYIHRGIEKMCESLTYPQTLALTDRLDYLGAHQNRHALCMCIEKAMGIEAVSYTHLDVYKRQWYGTRAAPAVRNGRRRNL